MQHGSPQRPRIAALLAAALTLASACGGENLVLPEDGVPASIVVVSGNNQNGTVGNPLAAPIVLRVLDVQGRPVQGQQVKFSNITGGGSATPATPSTDADGELSTTWTLGSTAGEQQLEARATGGAAPTNLAIVLKATASASTAAEIEAVSGNEQTATAGSTLNDSLIVLVTDAAGNPVAGVNVAWTVTGGGSVSEATTATNAAGRTGVRRTLGPTAGPQNTLATVAGLTGSPVTFTATATIGSAGKLVVVQQPSASAPSGAAFAQQPRVQVRDQNDNDVPVAGRAISVEIASGPQGATLGGATTVATSAAGLATFTNLSISGPAGSYTLNFTGANLSGASSSPVTLTAGAATRLAFTQQPSDVTAGEAITPAIEVSVQDALGQTVTGATNPITIAISTNPAGGTLSGTATANAVGGVATFSNLEINRSGTGYRLGASAPGLASATSSAFSVATGPASGMAASVTMPATTVAGGTVSPAPAVRITDASGNPVPGVNVMFATVNGGSASGETPTTNAQGVATVGSWTIGTTAGTAYQLQASVTGLSGSPVTFSTTATAGTAGKLTIETEPSAAGTSGTPLAQQPSVQLRDAANNPVNQAGVQITATINSGPTAVVSGGTAVTNGSGRATFTALGITGPSGTYTLNFSGPSITGVVSGDITIGAGAATKLGFSTAPPTTAQNGVAFATQPVIQLQDASGNPVGASGVTVNAFLQNGSGASLGGTISVLTNSSGVATFTDLSITGNLNPRVIVFASAGLTTLASPQITMTAGPVSASQSTLTVSPSSITAGNPGAGGSTVTVTARDASGNAIAGASVEPIAVAGGGSFTTPDPTNASGVTTATYTHTAAGLKEVGAEIDGVTIAQTRNITVTPAAASGTSSTLALNPTSIGVGGSATATVTARDAFNNLIPGAAVTVSITNGSAVPSAGNANSSGQFESTVSSSSAGTQTVSATVGGEAVTGVSLEVTTLATTTSVVTSGSPSVAGASVTFTATVSSAGPTPIGTVSFHDGGNCVAPGASIGSDALSGGSASVATSGLATGAHTIVACYPGNAAFAPSSGSVAQQVNEPANQSPTATDHAFNGVEDQVLSVPAPGVLSGAADADGTIAGALLAAGAANGSVALNADGSFTYTPNPDFNGADQFTYRVVDDDGAESPAATVSLTIAAVNDAPSFTPGAGPSASSADGPQVVANWITGITPGPANESGQAVAFEVTTGNDAAFATLPAVSATGTLTWEAAVVGVGTPVTVTITARDDGGTANGGIDTSSADVTFQVNP